MLRIALLVASLANVVAGLGLAGAYFRFRSGGGVPVIVLFIALSLFVQGAFTIGYLRGWLEEWRTRATQLFVAGESAAALVGTIGTLQGILYNLHPVNGDQEFGPLMAALLIGAQAALGLVYAARNGEVRRRVLNHSPGSGI